jgi:hypothetical protein
MRGDTVKVAVVDLGHIGMVAAVPTGPLQGW